MRIDLVTLMPRVIADFAATGVTGDATRRGSVDLHAWNPRDFCVSGRPDDRPYGGGAGMVLQAEPMARTIEAARAVNPGAPVIAMTPQGRVFDQGVAQQLAARPGLILVCGRYEGLDERFVETCVDMELSLGDFVLSGGDLAALVVIDAVARLKPGVLGDDESSQDESFIDGTLEYPHYTRPQSWRGLAVPEELTSGNHARIQQWRAKQALGRTWLKRPDLLEALDLDAPARALLREFINEVSSGTADDAQSD